MISDADIAPADSAALPQANAPSMTILYTETYSYDPIGDLTALRHVTSGSTWTRNFGFGGMKPQGWQTAWTTHLNSGNDWADAPPTQLTNFGNDHGGPCDIQLRRRRQPDEHYHV